MLVLKALIGLVVGAIVGLLLAVGAGYPLLLAAAGGRDMNGGIAMGMVTGLGPAGAVVGAIVGLLIVLAPASLFKGKSGLAIGGGVALLVVGYFVLLIVLQGPPKLRVDRADVAFEVRTDATLLADDDAFEPKVGLWDHYTDQTIDIPITVSVADGQAVLAGSYRVVDDMFRMQLRVQLSPRLHLTATVPTGPAMEVTQTFTGWIKVSAIHDPVTGDLELAYNQRTHMYRYKAVPREGE